MTSNFRMSHYDPRSYKSSQRRMPEEACESFRVKSLILLLLTKVILLFLERFYQQ